MNFRHYVFRLPHTGLYYSANRYFPQSETPDDGLTFVFLHNGAALKEIWEPTIDRLFELAAAFDTPRELRIREAWSLDWQNHGDSAILNEENLKKRDFFAMREVGDMIRHFMESDLVAGHAIVAVGHSASTTAWVLGSSRTKYLPLKAAIFIEPSMDAVPSAPSEKDVEQYIQRLQNTLLRRDTWDDIPSLTSWLKKAFPWKLWDPQILDLYIKNGFHEVIKNGRTLIVPKLTNIQEVGSYISKDHRAALDECAAFCARVPLHIFFSERSELLFKQQRKTICDSSQGRNMASVTILPNMGHWAVQEKPVLVADTIFSTLKGRRYEAHL